MTATNPPSRTNEAGGWRLPRSGVGTLTKWVVLATVFWCLPAFAQTPAEPVPAQDARTRADALFQEAVALFEAERFLEAATLMEQAFELDPNPRLAFNLARAFERGGNLDEALTYYWISADAPGDPELVSRAEESIERVQAEMDAQAPIPSTATPSPETAGSTSPSTTTSPGHTNQAAVVAATVPATPMSAQTSRRLRISGYSLLGTGAALTGVGALTAVQSQNRYDEAFALGEAGVEAARFGTAIDAGKQNQLLSTVAYGVGIAALVSGVSVLVFERVRRPDGASSTQASAWHVGPGAGACQTMLCVGAGLEF